MTIGKRGFVVLAALAALAGAIGWWSAGRGDQPVATVPAGERKVLYWYDPMVPDQHFAKPGKSPFMDMQLQPKYADEEVKSGVEVSAVTQHNLGVRTVAVEKSRLDGELAVSGTIAWDLRLERVVSARTEVIVDRLYVKAPFTKVRRGEPLASVIAPAWSSALAEAQAIAQSAETGTRELEAAAQARLRALGVPDGTQLGRDGRIVLTAPEQGVVSEIGVREGEVAVVGATLFRVNGTRTVWLQAAIPQAEAAGIAAGARVVAEVGGVARPVEGRVESLLPTLDPASRTQQARIVLANPDGVLAAGQQARVVLRSDAGHERLRVRGEAVTGSGEQAHVIVRHGDANIMPMAVGSGRRSGGRTEILSELEAGDQVVVSGKFLLDSEASLSGALERLGGHGTHP